MSKHVYFSINTVSNVLWVAIELNQGWFLHNVIILGHLISYLIHNVVAMTKIFTKNYIKFFEQRMDMGHI